MNRAARGIARACQPRSRRHAGGRPVRSCGRRERRDGSALPPGRLWTIRYGD